MSEEFLARVNKEKEAKAQAIWDKIGEEKLEDLDHSNMLNESVHEMKKAVNVNYMWTQGQHQKEDFGEADLFDLFGNTNSIAAIIYKKFNCKPKEKQK